MPKMIFFLGNVFSFTLLIQAVIKTGIIAYFIGK